MKRVAVTTSDYEGVRSAPYMEALRLVGVEPVVLIAGSLNARRFNIEQVDGLLLTGGPDIHPRVYGQDPELECGKSDIVLDGLDQRMFHQAFEAKKPVLGICRGSQMINVCTGGTLIQHLPTTDQHQVRSEDKGAVAHQVMVAAATHLFKVTGGERCVGVNSRHHQAVDILGKGLVSSAFCLDDPIVEAIEMPAEKFVIGVQWHPENMVATDLIQRRLFEAFAGAL